MNKYLAEFIGTFALLFVGTGAIVINDVTGGQVTHVGVALAFGLVIMVMIYAVGDVSKAHFNPAVTLGFWVAGHLPTRWMAPYIISQVAGSLLASIALRLFYPAHPTLGATLPAIAPLNAFVFEIILTFFLMFVIINVATTVNPDGIMAGVAIGGTVAMSALFAGPATGASMNPARSLAPALVSGHLADLWIYLLAPCLGAVLAVFYWRWMRPA